MTMWRRVGDDLAREGEASLPEIAKNLHLTERQVRNAIYRLRWDQGFKITSMGRKQFRLDENSSMKRAQEELDRLRLTKWERQVAEVILEIPSGRLATYAGQSGYAAGLSPGPAANRGG